MDREEKELLRMAGGMDLTKVGSGAQALQFTLDAVRRHDVMLPGHIASVVVTTLVLEGW